MARINLLLLSWFGTGYSPKAPGTMGSLAAVPFAWLMAASWGQHTLIIAAAVVFALGWAAAHATEEARRDPGWVVVDEVAGQWLTLAFVPPDIILYAIGFVLFRLFDIFKPWPVRTLEQKVPGALGVMVDDIAAALYAGALSYGAFRIIGA